LLAWKKAGGKISSETNWLWELTEVKIEDKMATEFSVKYTVDTLRSRRLNSDMSRNLGIPDQNKDWLLQKAILNKKKDILWRLFYRAMPLGYRLRHFVENETGDCPWCPNSLQSIEHFALECRISKNIWTVAYSFLKINQTISTPATLEEIFYVNRTISASHKKAVIWINSITIYEIWCQYTAIRWGNISHPETAIDRVVKNRIAKEIYTLRQENLNRSTIKDLLNVLI
jgi:hypothetical protein